MRDCENNDEYRSDDCEGAYEGARPDVLSRAIKGDARTEEEIRRISEELQIQKLFEWGGERSHGVDFKSLLEYPGGTAEHKVWCDVENGFAIKKTLPGTYGFIPHIEDGKLIHKASDVIGYLDRLALQNEIFGDEVIVLAVLPLEKSPELFAPEGRPVLTCQPWYFGKKDEPFPTEEEVSDYLNFHGFTPIKDAFYGWVHIEKSVYILDAKPDNFISTVSGVMPIDLQMAKIPTA